jgi:hypothetical protein
VAGVAPLSPHVVDDQLHRRRGAQRAAIDAHDFPLADRGEERAELPRAALAMVEALIRLQAQNALTASDLPRLRGEMALRIDAVGRGVGMVRVPFQSAQPVGDGLLQLSVAHVEQAQAAEAGGILRVRREAAPQPRHQPRPGRRPPDPIGDARTRTERRAIAWAQVAAGLGHPRQAPTLPPPRMAQALCPDRWPHPAGDAWSAGRDGAGRRGDAPD